jgi:histone deacetylase 1/2
MTASFHKFGDFFPGTGDIKDTGEFKGKNYSVNFPLGDGMDDKSFVSIFKPVIGKIMEMYQPGAIVLQCGADSVTGDRLGCFNITLKGHGEVVRFCKSFGVPLMVLGGGGYNIRNVSRCWAYETSVLLDHTVSNNIPFNDYFQYYGPDFKLHLQESDMANQNGRDYLDRVRHKVLQQLSSLEHAPSVQMHHAPPDMFAQPDDDEKEALPDERTSQAQRDAAVADERELYDGDGDQDGTNATRGHRRARTGDAMDMS